MENESRQQDETDSWRKGRPWQAGQQGETGRKLGKRFRAVAGDAGSPAAEGRLHELLMKSIRTSLLSPATFLNENWLMSTMSHSFPKAQI